MASSSELNGVEAEGHALKLSAELGSRLVPSFSFCNVRIRSDLFLGYQKLVKIDCSQLCLASFNLLYFVFLYCTFSNSVSLVPCGTMGYALRLRGCFVQKDP